MKDAIRHLDRRFANLRPLIAQQRPAKGWVRAIRDALGITSTQLASRIGVSQSRITELEKAEVSGSITFNSLERAAEAMDCRVLYFLMPNRPLAETIRKRAEWIADQQLAAVTHTMQLEDQAVRNNLAEETQREILIEKLISHPSRLWENR